jgi:hypothetical protein
MKWVISVSLLCSFMRCGGESASRSLPQVGPETVCCLMDPQLGCRWWVNSEIGCPEGEG